MIFNNLVLEEKKTGHIICWKHILRTFSHKREIQNDQIRLLGEIIYFISYCTCLDQEGETIVTETMSESMGEIWYIPEVQKERGYTNLKDKWAPKY